jgi:hypothetical protein
MTTAVAETPVATPAAPVVEAKSTATAIPVQATIPEVVKPVAEVTPVKAVETAPIDATAKRTVLSDAEPAKAEATKSEAPKAEVPAVIDYSTLKAPEKSALTADDVKAVAEFAKAKNLPLEAAQALVEHQDKVLAKQKSEYIASYDKFEGELKADKEFGGEKYSKTIDYAKRAAKKFLTVEERAQVESTPLGSHPILVKLLARMGAGLAEDSAAGTSAAGASAAPVHPAQRFYPDLYKNK